MSQFQNFYKYNIENSCKIHQKKKGKIEHEFEILGLKLKPFSKYNIRHVNLIIRTHYKSNRLNFFTYSPNYKTMHAITKLP